MEIERALELIGFAAMTGSTVNGDGPSIKAILAELARRQDEIHALQSHCEAIEAENNELRRERDTLIERWPDGINGCHEIELVDESPVEIWEALSPMKNGQYEGDEFLSRADAVRSAAGLPPKGGENVG